MPYLIYKMVIARPLLRTINLSIQPTTCPALPSASPSPPQFVSPPSPTLVLLTCVRPQSPAPPLARRRPAGFTGEVNELRSRAPLSPTHLRSPLCRLRPAGAPWTSRRILLAMGRRPAPLPGAILLRHGLLLMPLLCFLPSLMAFLLIPFSDAASSVLLLS